jgi:histidinol-phosphate aminotransferase
VLDAGDEIVCGWPSFPSYVIDALKLGAVPQRVPLREDRYDLEAMLAAVGPRTKLVYICHPNNPTGTMNTREELDRYFADVPDQVVTVLDQAYHEYIDDPDYADGVDEYLKRGCRVVVLRTFSKIFGLAGLRVGYALAPEDIVIAIGKVRRAFDVTLPAQEAALASLNGGGEVARRREENRKQRPAIEQALRANGFEPAGPTFGNFVFADVGEDSRSLFEALLAEGVIVRPTGGFGAPSAIRVTVGTAEENAIFADALGRVVADAAAPA